MSDRTATQGRGAPTSRRRTGWYGWIAFAGTMMILLGFFHALAGLVALFEEEYFLVTRTGMVISVDYTAWGWAHLILGVLVCAAGFALFAGQVWARFVAVLVAMLSAVINLVFMPSYPVWAGIMLAVDVLVIYAVVAHGDEA
jgi:hypothetical protein